MRDVEAHTFAGVSWEVERKHFSVTHGKHIGLAQPFRICARHVRIESIRPRREEIAVGKGSLTVGMDVNRYIVEGFSKMGCTA
jgi:hypothetical protein